MAMSEAVEGVLMAQHGMLGVHSSLSRHQRAKDEPEIPTRMVECRNGHGVIGQLWSGNLKQWIGSCPDCNDCPEGEQP